MASQYTITIRCTVAWWFLPYAALLKAFVIVTRRMPSDAHIERIARRAVRTELVEH
jgi:hypothetical protein